MKPIVFDDIKKHREEIINWTDNITEYNFLNPVLSNKYPQIGKPTAFKILKIKEVFHKNISEWPFNAPNFLIEDNSTKPISIVKKKINVNCIKG